MWKFFALSVCIPFAVAAQQSEIARRDRAMAQNTAVVSNDTGMVSPGNACGGAVKKAPGRELNIPSPWIGDGEKDREGAAFYDEDPAPEFTASFVLPRGVVSPSVTIACAGYYAIEFNGRGDIARRIVLHRGFPGWRHMLERGATTLTLFLHYIEIKVFNIS